MKKTEDVSNAIEGLRAAKASAQAKSEELAREKARATPGLQGEHREKVAQIAAMEAEHEHFTAREKARAALDEAEAEANEVHSPSTLLALLKDRLEGRAKLEAELRRIDEDLHRVLTEASSRGVKERAARDLPAPRVSTIVPSLQLPALVSAQARAYLPTAFAKAVAALESAAAGLPTRADLEDRIRGERGKLRSIELEIARRAKEAAEAKAEEDRLSDLRASKAKAIETAEANEREARVARLAAERAEEDRLIRDFGGAE